MTVTPLRVFNQRICLRGGPVDLVSGSDPAAYRKFVEVLERLEDQGKAA
ncbi:MAG: hypothetical protein ACKV22_12410 [Bryobacteraceae bacterium]